MEASGFSDVEIAQARFRVLGSQFSLSYVQVRRRVEIVNVRAGYR